MPSKVECDKGHRYGRTCREAAIEIAQAAETGWPTCKRLGCGAPLRYVSKQKYPSSADKEYVYEVEKVIRFRPDTAEGEKYDPMLFILRERTEGDRRLWPVHVWPFYWTHNRNGQWHVGQFPPLLTAKELRDALQGAGIE
jgi:hypothetical protein